MRWIDVRSYVGSDRRQRRNLRLLERREESIDGAPPSLSTALRQLRLHQLHTEKHEGLEKFCARATATAGLATYYGEEGVAKLLLLLVENLRLLPADDMLVLAQTIEDTMPEIEMAVRARR